MIVEIMLILHAITDCDATSVMVEKGKLHIYKLLNSRPNLREATD